MELFVVITELDSCHGTEIVSKHYTVKTLNTGTNLALIRLAVPTSMNIIALEIDLFTK